MRIIREDPAHVPNTAATWSRRQLRYAWLHSIFGLTVVAVAATIVYRPIWILIVPYIVGAIGAIFSIELHLTFTSVRESKRTRPSSKQPERRRPKDDATPRKEF